MAEQFDASQQTEPVRFWLQQIDASQKWHNDWHERGKKVNDRYLDEKTDALSGNGSSHRMNVLWSNVETITPALYAKTPTPKVQRRYRDKDAVGRWGGIVLERALGYHLDAYDVDYQVRLAIKEYLLPGRGQVWINYEPEFEGSGVNEKLSWEKVCPRHIHWRDFLTNPARTWEEVFWVAKREYLTKEEAESQRLDIKNLTFSEQKDDEGPSGKVGAKPNKAAVWEIWNKLDGKIYFVAKTATDFLRPPEAPKISFENFFPCPRPLTTTTTSDSILPVPDFAQYQNQAAEIDRLTQKINQLTKALRVAGVSDAACVGIQEILDDHADNRIIPVDNWAVYFGNKGLEGVLTMLPIKEIVEALQACYIARDQAKAVMYEVTGISDIVRGASDASETATAQQIKSQWGSLRIRDKQKEVQRFVRDIQRLQAEVIAEHFELPTLKAMSNAPLLMAQDKALLTKRKQVSALAAANPQQAQAIVAANPQLAQLAQPLSLDEEQALREPTWEEVIGLLKNEQLRSFRIDIETDSTINADEAEEKQSRIEFLTSMTSFMTTMGPMVLQAPKLAPLFGEMMMFGVRAFKAADTLESAIEEAVESLSQMALAPPPEQPADPKVELAAKQHDFAVQQHNDKMGAEKQRYEQDRADRQQLEDRNHNFERERFDAELKARADDALQQQQVRQQDREYAVNDNDTAHNRTLELKKMERGHQVEDRQAEKDDAAGETEQEAAATNAVVEAVTKMADVLAEGVEKLTQIASAPRTVDVQRDKSGKIIGGTAKPQIAGHA